MTLAAAVRDWKTANEIFQTTLLSQIFISILLWGCALAFALSINVGSYFGFRRINNSDAAVILVIMITYMLLGLMMSVYRAAYRASELEARGAMLLNFWRTSDLTIIIVVLSFHGTSVRLAECMLFGIFVWVTLGYLDVRRKCRKVRFGFNSISWMRLKEMVIHGLPVLVGQMTTALYMQGFPLVVNRSLGAATVVTLTTVRTVSRLGLLPIQTVAFSSSPQLSRSYGAQDRGLFGRLLKIMATACFWSALGVTIGLSSVGPWLISKWTGGRLTVDHTTICLFALSVSFQGVWTCCMVTLGSCNRHHLFNYAYFCIIVIALGAAAFLTRPYGFKVIPIIMLTADVIVATIGLYLCKTKIAYFNPRELLCIFQISFYKTIALKIATQRKMKGNSDFEEENRARDPGEF